MTAIDEAVEKIVRLPIRPRRNHYIKLDAKVILAAPEFRLRRIAIMVGTITFENDLQRSNFEALLRALEKRAKNYRQDPTGWYRDYNAHLAVRAAILALRTLRKKGL